MATYESIASLTEREKLILQDSINRFLRNEYARHLRERRKRIQALRLGGTDDGLRIIGAEPEPADDSIRPDAEYRGDQV